VSKIIGIDLGTTNSCAAIVENGQVKLIPYKGGEFIIPSIFAIDEKGNELIGHEAKRQWQLNPRNTVYAAKRLVGRSFNSGVVEAMRKTVAYEMKPGATTWCSTSATRIFAWPRSAPRSSTRYAASRRIIWASRSPAPWSPSPPISPTGSARR
jgi:molecular chaperone DnaK (HSP70)